MSGTSDILTVYFDTESKDESALCVSRKYKGKIIMLKMELGEQADILYHLLTEQMTKAEIKEESKSKEKQKQEYKSKQLLDELSKMPHMVIATAYLHAVNYTLYGADVTEKWATAVQQASALERAYQKGFHDAMERAIQEAKAREILRECTESEGENDQT